MADSLRELAFCPVCRDPMLDARVLQCGHTFCLQCLHKIYHQRKSIPCPVCRAVTQPGENPLPKNQAVREIAKKVHEERQRESVKRIAGDNPTAETLKLAIAEREEQLKLEADEEQLMRDWIFGIWKVVEDAEKRAKCCYSSWKSRVKREKEMLEEMLRKQESAGAAETQAVPASASRQQRPQKPDEFPTFSREEADKLTRDFQSLGERLTSFVGRIGGPEDQAKAARMLQGLEEGQRQKLLLVRMRKPGEARQQ